MTPEQAKRKSEYNKHLSLVYGKTPRRIEQKKINANNFKTRNPEYSRNYYLLHKEEVKERARLYREKFPVECKAWHKENYRKNRPAFLDYKLKKNYGITLLEFESMMSQQKGKCLICDKDMDGSTKGLRPSVDHCHSTGKVRGLLCNICNLAIGQLKDSSLLLRRAADYLDLPR